MNPGFHMTLSDLASIGSFVSGVAVLISLVYVAVQIRQAERNQRTLLQHGTSTRAVELVRHWSDPYIAEAYVKMLSGDQNLTAVEAFQLSIQFRTSLLSWQDSFLLQRASLIDSLQLESTLRTFRVLLAQPVLRALWTMSKATFSPEFVEHVETNTMHLPLAAPHDYAEQLKAAIAEVKAAAAR
jgi:hypothetical protein